MIPFNPIRDGSPLLNRVQEAISLAFSFAQSGRDLAAAITAIFTSSTPGGKTLTLGTTAPNSIQTLTPTRWVTIIEADGLPTIMPGYR